MSESCNWVCVSEVSANHMTREQISLNLGVTGRRRHRAIGHAHYAGDFVAHFSGSDVGVFRDLEADRDVAALRSASLM